MSDPLSPPPKIEEPPAPLISDRSALEAAILGAASLVLGRVLLGRGAGLLAGAAAIAARLASNASKQEDTAHSDTKPDPGPASPISDPAGSMATENLSPCEDSIAPTAPAPVQEATFPPPPQVTVIEPSVPPSAAPWSLPIAPPFQAPGPAPLQVPSDPTAWESPTDPAPLSGTSLFPLISPLTSIPLPPWDAEPATKPEDEAASTESEHPVVTAAESAFSVGIPLFRQDASPSAMADQKSHPDVITPTDAEAGTAAGEATFPVLFLETPSGDEPIQKLAAPPEETDSTLPEAGPPAPFPALPVWIKTMPSALRDHAGSATDIQVPSEGDHAPVAKLPHFPQISLALPDPNEIWKMAGEETSLVPAEDSSPTPAQPPPFARDAPVRSSPPDLGDLPAFPILSSGTAPLAQPGPAADPTGPEKATLLPFVKNTQSPGLPVLTNPWEPFIESRPAEALPKSNPPPIKDHTTAGIDSTLHLPLLTLQLPSATGLPRSLSAEPVRNQPATAPVSSKFDESSGDASPPPTLKIASPLLPSPPSGLGLPMVSGAILLRPETSLPPPVPGSLPLPGSSNPVALPKPPQGSAWKAWAIIVFILAALALIWRNELGKQAPQQKSSPDIINSRPPANDSAAPSIPPLPTNSPPPAPPPTPVAPSSAVPVVHEKPAINPPPAPSVPAANNQKAPVPVIYADPSPGVSQDFLPGSSEAKARQSLEKLLDSDSSSDLAQLVLEPADIQKNFTDQEINPIPRKRILFDASENIPRSTQKYHLFRVITDEVPMGFPVAIEDTASGPRIDYTAFIQCRDQLLDKFMAAPSAKSQPFMVTLRRGHYFGNEVPQAELDKLVCLEIASPNPSSPRHTVFIPRGSELGSLALNKYTWERIYTPVIELSRKGRLVHIISILGDTWQKPGRAQGKTGK